MFPGISDLIDGFKCSAKNELMYFFPYVLTVAMDYIKQFLWRMSSHCQHLLSWCSDTSSLPRSTGISLEQGDFSIMYFLN